MPSAKYMAARILKMDYRSLVKTARAVSKKTKRPLPAVMKDIVHCGMKYQAGYNDYLEFEFYLLNEEQRATYLTRGKNNDIIKRYNDKTYEHFFEDKIEFNNTFKSYVNREFMDLKTASFEDFRRFVARNPKIIAKPSGGLGGEGVDKYSVKDYVDVKKMYDTIMANKQDLIETFVVQHDELNRLYPKSVNTMRMFTFVKDGKGHFLQAILKIGNGGVVDNFSSGGMYTFTDDEGVVDVPAIDKADIQYTVHPITGTDIIGFRVPMFREAVKLVERAAEVIPQIAYVGWDVAISDKGPVIIEGNSFPGVFQRRASFSKDKTGVIPRYREYMDI